MKLLDLFKKARPTKAPKATFSCVRCKKELTEDQCHWIGSHRFCESCAAPPQKSTIEKHLEDEAKEATYQARMDQLTERLDQRERFRKLSIGEQIQELTNHKQENDTVIGTIYIHTPPKFNERSQLKKLLGNASIVEEYSVGGHGDTTVHLILAVNDLLIGATYFAYWRGEFSMDQECKVYRFAKNKSLKSLDLKEIQRSLFGY